MRVLLLSLLSWVLVWLGCPLARADDAAVPRIGSITIRVGEIFDTSKPGENKALYRLANRLHIDTRESALRAQLLFAEGDAYSPRVLEETERVLRKLRFIREPRVRAGATHDGVVDIEVFAQDVWTLSPGLSFGRKGGSNSSSFEFDDYNVFGSGKHFAIGSHNTVDRSSTELLWVDPNVLGSRWTARANYADADDGSTQSLAIARPFYSLDSRWTAALLLSRDDGTQHRYALGKRADEFHRNTRLADLHVGTSQGWDSGWVRRTRFGLRMDEARFSNDPLYAASVALPTDRAFSYPYAQLEFIQDDFATSVNQDQIERTEDFQFGRQFMLELGLADAAFGGDSSAAMLRAEASRGWRLHDKHRLFFGATVSGRLENGNARNALFGASAKYYWRTSEDSLFHVSLRTDFGHALDLDNELTLGGDNGLRGYPLRYQTGSGRALLTLEQRYYTDWYPWRLFHIGGAIFTDLGRSFGPSALRAAQGAPQLGTLRDVGFGLRLSNSRSALANVLHIDVAFPLDGDPSIDSLQFLIETKRSF